MPRSGESPLRGACPNGRDRSYGPTVPSILSESALAWIVVPGAWAGMADAVVRDLNVLNALSGSRASRVNLLA